jgi:hypothetical protein
MHAQKDWLFKAASWGTFDASYLLMLESEVSKLCPGVVQ